MPRFVLSAMALAGLLATTLPALAEPPSDDAQVAAAATPPPAPAVPARLSPSAAHDSHDTDIIPVGLGWG
jgi:hypothetical protein